jgi:hypothetical protein
MGKRGILCEVPQKFRSFKLHYDKMHIRKIALKCTIGNCGWSCVHSIRCLTSHIDNLENHGKLSYKGDFNLDDSCVVVPFVVEDLSAELVNGHFVECVDAKKALIQFTAKMKKRAERAAAAEKRKDEKKNSGVKPETIAISKKSVNGTKGPHSPHPPKQVICEPEESLVTSSKKQMRSDTWRKDALEGLEAALESSGEETVDDLADSDEEVTSTTSDYTPVEELAKDVITTDVIPTEVNKQEASTSSKNGGKGCKNLPLYQC